jgi:hypothetical protein
MATKKDRSELIPVHVSRNELLFMNEMQKHAIGKSHIEDEHTGLPSYPGLSSFIKSPEGQKMFKGALYALKTNAKMPPEVSQAYAKSKSKILKKGLGPNNIEESAGTREIAKAGDGNDKELALVPIDVVDFLDQNEGTKKKDSKFGLQEFAFYDNVFDMVGSALVGSEKREKHMWGEAIGGAGLLVSGWLNHMADENENDRYEARMREYRAEKEAQERRRQASADRWNKGGLKTTLYYPQKNKFTQHGIDEPRGKRYKKGGLVLGKPIKGPGHGQEDLIDRDLPKNTWIFDAHTVSNFGNGSSDAGHKELGKLYKYAAEKLKKTPGLKEKIEVDLKPQSLPQIPCSIANDEADLKPVGVAVLGEGTTDLGCKILRDMTETLRKIKISKGTKLPPPAPDVIDLYKSSARKHGLEV